MSTICIIAYYYCRVGLSTIDLSVFETLDTQSYSPRTLALLVVALVAREQRPRLALHVRPREERRLAQCKVLGPCQSVRPNE
jgi:hypothetical protein